MRLELGTFHVNDITFSDRTRWSDGTLEVDEARVLAAIRHDRRVTNARLELVKPGDSVRITSVRDVIEPRVKVEGPGVAYPGIIGRPVTTVGSGRTHRLTGMSVIEVAEVEFYHGNDAWLDTFIDMAGPGAVTPYSSLRNICVVLEIDPDHTIEDRNDACHRAALLVSDTLAGATRGLEPPEVETFELTPALPGTPRAVYICCLRSPQHYADSLYAFWTSIYGLSRQTTPWLLHPNEIIDGAISVRNSWDLANNPVVQDMYAAHGTEIDFAGVLALRTRWSAQSEKDITSQQAAKFAQMLGATGAVITYDAGGNDFMEAIRTVQACENAGIKTVFVTGEESPDTGGPPLLEPLPEARAIVSLGQGGGIPGSGAAIADTGPIPGLDRLIGQDTLVEDPSQRSRVVPANGTLPGPRWSDHYGFGRQTALAY
ncbi:MAG: glycine/sarcosine/betaine reductase component B subunit [Dehalococcoidia bacterium]